MTRSWWFSRQCGALLFSCAVLSGAAEAEAQQPLPVPAVIVVDMNQIMHDSKAAKDVQAQLDKVQEGYSKDFGSRERELKAAQDELERQRMAMAPDLLNTRARELQQRYASLDREYQMTRQNLQQSLNDAMTKIGDAALHIIEDIAKERKANMVVAKAALLYLAPGLDVTPEVTHRLDEKLPAVALNIPHEGSADAAAATKPKAAAAPAKN